MLKLHMHTKLREIRACVGAGSFSVTPAVLDALRLEDLTVIDLEAAILRGRLTALYGKDGAGCRYVVTGRTTSGEVVRVLCRFSTSRRLILLNPNGRGSAHSTKYLPW